MQARQQIDIEAQVITLAALFSLCQDESWRLQPPSWKTSIGLKAEFPQLVNRIRAFQQQGHIENIEQLCQTLADELEDALIQNEKIKSVQTLRKLLKHLMKDDQELAKTQFKLLQNRFAANKELTDISQAEQAGTLTVKQYVDRGLIYKDYEFIGYAIKEFTRAIDLYRQNKPQEFEKDYAFALRKRSQLYILQGKYAAIDDAKEAARVTPRNPGAHFDYGASLYHFNQLEQAQEHLQTVQKLEDPNRPYMGGAQTRAMLRDIEKRLNPSLFEEKADDVLLAHLQQEQRAGLDIAAMDGYGKYILLEAVRIRHIDAVGWLLEHNARTDRQDKEGNTALHIAALEGDVKLIEKLAPCSDCAKGNDEGLPPLFLAIKKRQVDSIDPLLLYTAPEVTVEGYNALQYAMHQQPLSLMLLHALLKSEALISHSGGYAALLKVAIDLDRPPILRCLLEYKPEALKEQIQDQSLLQYALAQNKNNIMWILREMVGADEDEKINEMVAVPGGINPQIAATIRGHNQAQAVKKERLNQCIDQIITSLETADQETAKYPWPITEVKHADNRAKIKERLRECLSVNEHVLALLSVQPPYEDLQNALVEHIEKQRKKIIIKHKLSKDKINSTALKTAIDAGLNSGWQNGLPESPTVHPVVSEHNNEEQILNQFRETDAYHNFCAKFEKEFDEWYGYFKAMDKGELVSKQDEFDKLAKAGLQASEALPNISVPFTSFEIPTGAIMRGAIHIGTYIRERYRQNQARRMVELFAALSPHERTGFVLYTAEQLADKYVRQLGYLNSGSEGVEQFAECAVARVVDFITDRDNNLIAEKPNLFQRAFRAANAWLTKREIPPQEQRQKDLIDVFLEGVVRVTSKFPLEKKRLRTKGDSFTDNWCAKGVFENTGILTEAGQRFAHANVDLAKYGYCSGSQAEANHRGLTLGPTKKTHWGVGRDWPIAQAYSLSPVHYVAEHSFHQAANQASSNDEKVNEQVGLKHN